MTDDFRMCSDKKHEALERVMKLRNEILDAANELNSNMVAFTLSNPTISESERVERLEEIVHVKKQQNAATELDVLYLESCLERGTINPDSFTQSD